MKIWENLYYCLNTDGDESSPRGMKVRETLGCNIIIVNPKDNLVYSEARKLSPYYLAGEYFWYKSGNNNWESIYNHSKFCKLNLPHCKLEYIIRESKPNITTPHISSTK